MSKGFTLLEILITVIIIGILSAIAIPNYTKSRERSLDKEAQIVLNLIHAAEKMHYMRSTSYYPNVASTSVDVSGINSNLRLNLYSANWDFGINTNSITAATATAKRKNASSSWDREWQLAASDFVATAACSSSASGACP